MWEVHFSVVCLALINMLDREGLWLPGCFDEYLCPPIKWLCMGNVMTVDMFEYRLDIAIYKAPQVQAWLCKRYMLGVLICWIVMGGIGGGGGGGGGGEGWWGVPALISHPISLLRPSLHSPPGCNAFAHRPAANDKGSALQIQLQHKQKILMQRKIVWLERLIGFWQYLPSVFCRLCICIFKCFCQVNFSTLPGKEVVVVVVVCTIIILTCARKQARPRAAHSHEKQISKCTWNK